jgi:hypothetical protein
MPKKRRCVTLPVDLDELIAREAQLRGIGFSTVLTGFLRIGVEAYLMETDDTVRTSMLFQYRAIPAAPGLGEEPEIAGTPAEETF